MSIPALPILGMSIPRCPPCSRCCQLPPPQCRAEQSPRLPILRSLLGSGSKPDCRAHKPGLDCLLARQMSPSCSPDGSLYSPAPSPPVFAAHAERRACCLKARDEQPRLACIQRLLGNSLCVYKGAWLSAAVLGTLAAFTGGSPRSVWCRHTQRVRPQPALAIPSQLHPSAVCKHLLWLLLESCSRCSP